MAEAVGLSIGATNLAVAAPPRCPAARRSVLTLYRHRPPEVGVPSDNANLNEPGLVITGFVDRVGDPVPIAAADGSIHRGETLVAKALRALCYEMTNGRPAAAPASVAFPAHWDVPTVEALRRALTAFGEWPLGANHLPLVSDATAALTALQAEPGLPARGVIALCDFGGTGTSITLVDAADGYRSIGTTVRHVEFSGDAIDHALLMHVIANLPVGATDDSGTSAIASLTRLRAQCRGAKEQLSATSVCSFVADVPGYRGTIRLTRNELDDLLRRPLAQVIGIVQEALHRNGIRGVDLVGVATAGGGAAIPAVTTALSEQLRVPVITTRWPQLTAAAGAARLAARDPGDDVITAAAPVLTAAAPVLTAAAAADTVARSSAFPALAWSQEDDSAAESLPVEPYVGDYGSPQQTYWPAELSSARPQLEFQPDESLPRSTAPAPQPWYRRPLVAAAAATALISLTAWSVGLRNDSTPLSGTPSTPVRSTPVTTAPATASGQQDPGQPGPAPAVMQAPTPVAQIRQIEPPAGAAQAPDPQANPALPPPEAPIIIQAPAVPPQAPTTTDAPTTTTSQAPTSTPPTTTQPPTTTPPPTTTQAPTTQPPTTTHIPTTTQISTTPRPPTTTQVPTTTQPPPTHPPSSRPPTTPSTTARPPG